MYATKRLQERYGVELSDLKPGDDHYMAFVGPPTQYDFMGATQFRLLCSLGLRSEDFLLDFGCGSLRAGRLFIAYLDEGRYCGVEPNRWLIQEAVEQQVGQDLIRIKKPRFDHNEDFSVKGFGLQFDFILAQSIFSHTASDLLKVALENFCESLKTDGVIAATFVEGPKDYQGKGWVYPDCVTYRPSTLQRLVEEAGLFQVRIPWYHPRQTWYVLAKTESKLPSPGMFKYLTGAVLFAPEFTESWKTSQRLVHPVKRRLVAAFPPALWKRLRRFGRR
jgi:SAM-dependent methyltransferase